MPGPQENKIGQQYARTGRVEVDQFTVFYTLLLILWQTPRSKGRPSHPETTEATSEVSSPSFRPSFMRQVALNISI